MMTSTATKRPNRIKKARVYSSFHVFELNYPEITWGSTIQYETPKGVHKNPNPFEEDTELERAKSAIWLSLVIFPPIFPFSCFLLLSIFFPSSLQSNSVLNSRIFGQDSFDFFNFFFSLKRKVSVSRFEKKRNCSPVLCEFDISHSIICIWYFWFCFRSLIACFRFELRQEFEDYLIDVLIVIIKLQRD